MAHAPACVCDRGQCQKDRSVALPAGARGSALAGTAAALRDVANFNLYDGQCYAAADPLLALLGRAETSPPAWGIS